MDSYSRRSFLAVAVGSAGLIGPATCRALSAAAVAGEPTAADLAAKAVAFLRPRQGRDGSWSGDREPGITALVVTAMLRSGQITPEDRVITRGLSFLEKYIGPKGGLSEAPHSVYTTSVALMAFHAANVRGRFDRIIKGSQDFLKTTQTDEGEGKNRENLEYGGLGYGGKNSRPDLSNTAFFVEALRESGLPATDMALRKALVFVSRCQNLDSEFNDQPRPGAPTTVASSTTPAPAASATARPPSPPTRACVPMPE